MPPPAIALCGGIPGRPGILAGQKRFDKTIIELLMDKGAKAADVSVACLFDEAQRDGPGAAPALRTDAGSISKLAALRVQSLDSEPGFRVCGRDRRRSIRRPARSSFSGADLPAGFPASLPPEYLRYQAWNVVQARNIFQAWNMFQALVLWSGL